MFDKPKNDHHNNWRIVDKITRWREILANIILQLIWQKCYDPL